MLYLNLDFCGLFLMKIVSLQAEIRGHRRTYVASGPGLIVQALRKAGRSDPILLL